jgi:hypothetical protein
MGVSNNQRRKHFIDNRLQGRLLVALVLLESMMLALAIIYLYIQFKGIVEQNLYSIHRTSQQALLPLFLEQLGWVVLVMSITNTLALYLAHHLWILHVKLIVAAFRETLLRVKSLDFASPVKNTLGVEHEVLILLNQWYRGERQRIFRLRQIINSLSKPSTLLEEPQSLRENGDIEKLRAGLQEVKRLLRLHHYVNNEHQPGSL